MYDKDMLLQILINPSFRTIDSNGKILPPRNEVYIKISEEMKNQGSNINPKHIYTILNTNRGIFLSEVLHIYNINNNKRQIVQQDESTNISHTELHTEHKISVSYKVIVSADKWEAMKPESLVYGDKQYVTLKRRVWTHIIAEKIYAQTNIPCAITFKSGRIYKRSSAQCYVHIKGHCNECGAIIDGKLFSKPVADRDNIFEFLVTDFDTKVIHKRKRPLARYLRQKVAAHLVDTNKPASVWRAEQAKLLMKFGDEIPPNIPYEHVLRKAKQQEIDKRLGLENTNPIINLCVAKYEEQIGSIRAIGMDPFYCMYWLKEQLEMYKSGYRSLDSYMTIDATGSVAKKLIVYGNITSAHIFLYQCVLAFENSNNPSIPVFQMVSSKQDASIITYFLSEIIRSGAHKPRIATSDFGRAILVALAKAFANCADLKHYLQICFQICFMKADLSPDNSNIKIPACFLRLDVSHLIGMVAKWDCLRKKTAKVRQFYIRSIAQIYQMSDMQDITYLLKCILTIALSQEIGVNNSNDPVHSELCLRHVNRIIKQGVLVNDVLENDDEVEKEEDYETISASDDGISCWKTWSQKIFTTAKELAEQSVDGDVLNALYNPTAASKLKDLITFIPLWTGIMRPHFKIGDTVAKSSPVEGAFSNLKNIVFKGRLPMRVDKFVIQHLNYLDGKLKLACAEHNKVKNIISDSETRPQSDSTVFASIEEKTRSSMYTVSNKTSFSTTTKDDTSTINNITKQLSLNEIDKNASSPSWTNDENNNQITETFTSFTVSSSLVEKKTKLSNSTVASELEFIVPYAKTSTPLKEDPQKEKNTFLVSNESENELNNKENWRGKDKTDTNKRKRKIDTNNEKYRKKLNYLDACADWDFLPNGPAVGIPLIPNGNLYEPVHCDGIKVIIKDTCAFDSLLQVIMSAIATNPSYKKATCAIDSKIAKLAERLLTDGKVTAAARIERARILRDVPIFQKSQYTRQLETLNANCNAAHLAEYILHPSYTRSLRCDTCKTTSERSFTFLNINIDIIFQNGPGHMQDAINNAINTNYICKNCKKAQDYNLIYGPHVLIDMSILTDLNYIPLKLSKLPLGCMELNAISKRIEVRGIFYNLIGAIRYIGHTTTNGHYTGIVYIGLKWYEYDDLLRKRTPLQSTFEIIPHVLIYIRQ